MTTINPAPPLTTRYERVPPGKDAPDPRPGDFILCHRRGLASSMIRFGERIRFKSGARWSHAAYVETPTTLIEALTRDVRRTPLATYRDIEYLLVRTNLSPTDEKQATAFARSCLGQHYGWVIIVGDAMRFCTWGRGLWFGMNGTEICSGLVGQTQVRGWANYTVNPATLSPAELAGEHNVPDR